MNTARLLLLFFGAAACGGSSPLPLEVDLKPDAGRAPGRVRAEAGVDAVHASDAWKAPPDAARMPQDAGLVPEGGDVGVPPEDAWTAPPEGGADRPAPLPDAGTSCTGPRTCASLCTVPRAPSVPLSCGVMTLPGTCGGADAGDGYLFCDCGACQPVVSGNHTLCFYCASNRCLATAPDPQTLACVPDASSPTL
jgi:hypothetical protein